MSRVIFFIRHQWLLRTTAQEKSEDRNKNYQKNLHRPFLPMHRIGNRGKCN